MSVCFWSDDVENLLRSKIVGPKRGICGSCQLMYIYAYVFVYACYLLFFFLNSTYMVNKDEYN